MYNGYPRNKNNLSNKPRNKTDLRMSKYKVCKTSNMHREEINDKKVIYRDNFLSEIGHNCGTHGTHKICNNLSKTLILLVPVRTVISTSIFCEYSMR